MKTVGAGYPAPLISGEDMRRIDIPTIEMNGEKYPVYCDLYVFQQIQEKMDINDFERKVIGARIVRDEDGQPVFDKDKRFRLEFVGPDINTLIFGLTLMINEGLLIQSEQENIDLEPVDEKYIARISDMSVIELSNIVHEAFGRCCGSKKNIKQNPRSRKKNISK